MFPHVWGFEMRNKYIHLDSVKDRGCDVSIEVVRICIAAKRLAHKRPTMKIRRILRRRDIPRCIRGHKMVPLFCTLYCTDCHTMWSVDWIRTTPVHYNWPLQCLHRLWWWRAMTKLLEKIWNWNLNFFSSNFSLFLDVLPAQCVVMTKNITIVDGTRYIFDG